MDKKKYQIVLKDYLPEKAIDGVIELLDKHPVHLIITRKRVTKHGDFKVLRNGQLQITVNHDLNKYSFLLTLIHELAHLTTYKKIKKNVKPHGIEWKNEFKYLMLPFLNNFVFPNNVLPYLAQYLKNPKAATGSDVQLSMALKGYDAASDTTHLFELTTGDEFILRKKSFILGNKRRTRYECVEKFTNKKYLIHINAEIKRL